MPYYLCTIVEGYKAYFVIVVENRTKIGPNWQNKLSDPGYSSRIAVRYPEHRISKIC